eukprot:scaffold4802_cov96-Skeletonema_dohrnii-CCMP3373.AAC.2
MASGATRSPIISSVIYSNDESMPLRDYSTSSWILAAIDLKMNRREIRESQRLALLRLERAELHYVLMARHPPPMDLPPQTDSP